MAEEEMPKHGLEKDIPEIDEISKTVKENFLDFTEKAERENLEIAEGPEETEGLEIAEGQEVSEETEDSDDSEEEAASAEKKVKSGPAHASPGSSLADGEDKKGLSMGVAAGIAVIALVAGLLIGMFAFGGGFPGSPLAGKQTVAETELDAPIATYTSPAGNGSLSVRDVISQQSSIAAAQDADGRFILPGAESVVTAARNTILLADAEKRGIAVTDEEVAAYAEENLGTSDFAGIADNYAMDEETVKKLLTSSCVMQKLQQEVAPGSDALPEMPDPPAQPEANEGEEPDYSAKTKDYAKYIIGLAGDEWDAAADTWASDEGEYAQALAEYEISAKDGASYEAAATAYSVAYQGYLDEASAKSEAWSNYVNELMSNATISIDTLVS